MDHLRDTPNFSLQHLRFLIIDEADRLLTQSFQDWLNQVLTHLKPAGKVDARDMSSDARISRGHDAVAPSWYDDLGLGQGDWEGKRPFKHSVSRSYDKACHAANIDLFFRIDSVKNCCSPPP